MANFYNTTATSKLDWAMPFHRTGSFPIDRTSIHNSVADAELYASGGADSRGDSGTAFAGQYISVVTDTRTYYVEGDTIPEGKAIGDVKSGNITAVPYLIQGDGTIKAIGSDADAVLSDPWTEYSE